MQSSLWYRIVVSPMAIFSAAGQILEISDMMKNVLLYITTVHLVWLILIKLSFPFLCI